MGKVNGRARLRWFAIRCHSARVVAKAAAEIGRLGVPTFVPKSYRLERQGRWLVSVEDGLLFPPYLFIKKRPPGTWKSRSSMVWGALMDVDGVAQVMGYHRNDGELVPVAIPYDIMRPLLAGEESAQHRKEANRLKPKQRVKIMAGPFAGFEGIFDKPVKERVRILVQIFGRESGIELGEDEVRAA